MEIGIAGPSEQFVDPVNRQEPSPEEVRDELNRILTSPTFRRSERLRRFLCFAVDHALAGTSSEIKEYSIGREVFDRGDTFDPRVDSIVRVESRRLRSKLRDYYTKFGSGDSIVIGMNPGSYIPLFRYWTEELSNKQPSATPAGQGGLDALSVAVLPFVNLSPDPDQDFFCDGIAEELLNALTAVPELRVVARTSAFYFKGKSIDIREIGRQLGAGTIVEGSVRNAGGRLRITAQIINAVTGVHLWSHTFDRDLTDVFAVQDEIAIAVKNALSVSLVPHEVESHTLNDAPHLDAYITYLKGRHFWNDISADGIAAALNQFTQAIALKHDYAPPYAGLAGALTKLTFWGVLRPSEGISKARRAAEEALRLNPRLASAHAVLGGILSLGDWRRDDGERSIARAIGLEPSNVVAHTMLLVHHLCLGRFPQARIAVENCTRLDPISPLSLRAWGWYYYFTRDYDRAIEKLQAAQAIDPRFREAQFFLAHSYLRKGNYVEAIELLHRLPEAVVYQGTKWGALGEAYALVGDTAAAQESLMMLEALAQTTYVSPICRLSIHAGLGDWDRVWEGLQQAFEERSVWLNLVKIEPRYDAIRTDRRFTKILESLGLAGQTVQARA